MTETKIRQSEFAAQHNLKAPEVAALRREHLKEGVDFWSEGRAIYWSEGATRRVDNIIRGIIVPVETDFGTVTFIPSGLNSYEDETNISPDLEMSPVEYVEPETFTVRTTRPCRNKRMTYADLNGQKIAVIIGRNRDKMLKKTIAVRKNPDSDIYTYLP